MFAQHERVKVIDSAPAAWYRRYCPCSTLSFRLFKDTARVSGPSQMSRVSAEVSLEVTHLIWQSRWHLCWAELSHCVTFCPFHCSESRIKWWNDVQKNKKWCTCVLNALWNHENEITFLVHVEHFSSPSFQSSSITCGVLRGNECRQAAIQRHRV